MDLWGAGINFILDGEKIKKARKILRIFWDKFKIEARDAKILETNRFFHTADDGRSACAQYNI